LTGWAERQARQLAERFAMRGHRVQVLTTTAKSPSEDWELNHFPAGESVDNDVVVRRFRVDRRDHDAFDRANAFLLSQPLAVRRMVLPKGHVKAFVEENITSRALLAYLAEHGQGYDSLIFLPYLYGPTLSGLPLVRERAWLQPCLHHECYALLPQVGSLFHQAKGLLFNSDGEAELALRLYGPGIREKSHVVGEWIDEPAQSQTVSGRVGQFTPGRERYILYLGRRDETKNVGLLIESFLMYRRQNYSTTLKLVLAGVGTTSYHDELHGVIDLGVVTEPQRDLLIEDCLALFQPSYNESFSRVVMEAWSRSRPVAVNAQCISTAQAVRRSEGGWLAATKSEWADVMRLVDTLAPAQLVALGGRGNQYYRRTATPEGVMERYEAAMKIGDRETRSQNAQIYHLLPSLDLTEDVVRRALTVDGWLRERDVQTTIDAQPKARGPLPDGMVLAVHSPLADDLERAATSGGDVVLFYDGATMVERAVWQLAPKLRLAYTTDEPAAEFLRSAGAREVAVLPFALGMRCWDVDPDPTLLGDLDDGRFNCLFAGRLDKQSCCEQLISAFAYLISLEVDARLVIAGAFDPANRYHAHLATMIAEYRLSERVRFIRTSEAPLLAAAYRTAHIFWSMSEGLSSLSSFVDAMWFDVPILAYGAHRLVRLLGAGGLLINQKEDLLRTAALAKILLKDADLRAHVIAEQETRRNAFVPSAQDYSSLERLIGRAEVAAG
jgi:glycosyltransferase involved in cell wall biosynthesis